MTESATITFSQAGVQPPVYVVTSLSDPPWAPLEMAVNEDEADAGNLIFSRRFENVAAGDYQYKIREGDGHWVVDESKDSATDQHGNRNNVLHVRPKKAPESQRSNDPSTEGPRAQNDPSVTSEDSRKDSTTDSSHASDSANLPIPIAVVDKVAGEEQLGEGAIGSLKTPDVSPFIDSGQHREPGTEKEQAAPLFGHESFQDDEEASASALDTIEEASIGDRTSSQVAGDTSSGYGESHKSSESGSAPVLSHELSDDEEAFDELSNGPLLSHETGMNGGIESSGDYIDELDAAPLLPHETGFSQYRDSEATTNSGYTEDNISEPRHHMYEDDDEDDYRTRSLQPDEAPTFTRGDSQDASSDRDEYSEDDTPLLPHERDFAAAYSSSPEESGQPTFDYVRNASNEPFGRNGRASIFRNRANSSTLPDKLPRTDAEDENLADPSLERFPTRREQILERVASIGLQLPEDQPMEDHIHSPVGSVLSQACSSVDLVAVKSYTSLASVPEADNSDEDDADADSLPSPMFMTFGSASTAFAKDPYKTPMPNDSKRIGVDGDASRASPEAHTGQSSETASIAKTDGVKESAIRKLQDATAIATNVHHPITPPLTPDSNMNTATRNEPQPASEPELRQRHVHKEDATKNSSTVPAEPAGHKDNTPDRAVTSSNPQHLSTNNESFLQTFLRVVFGSVGRFLTGCVGDRKRAGVAVLALSVATIAYYLLA